VTRLVRVTCGAKNSISLQVLFIGRLDGLTCVELRTSLSCGSDLLQVTELVRVTGTDRQRASEKGGGGGDRQREREREREENVDIDTQTLKYNLSERYEF
jgi:hypothetical protein